MRTSPSTRSETSVHRRIRWWLVPATAAIFFAASCSDDDTQANNEPRELSVVATNYAFGGLPATVAAGSTVAFTNEATDEVHEIVLFRLPDDETRSAAELAALDEAESADLFVGEPALVAIAAPSAGGENVVGDGVLTESGRYVAFCAIQIGADPDAYFAALETSEGPVTLPDAGAPHFTAGMYGEIEVTPASSG